MKKLIVVATLIALSSFAPVAKAESVRTCSTYTNVYGGGEVCGETTTNTTETHNISETNTGANDSQMIKLLLSIAGAAALATGLYKLTYKSYIFG